MGTENQTRITIDLGGTWSYKLDREGVGTAQQWFAPALDRSDWKPMKIPNNWYLTEVGDYDGTVWFQTAFTPPADLKGKRLFLHFGAVDYIAAVWLNGVYLGKHEGMFLPFEFEVTGKVKLGAENVLVVRDDSPRDPTEYLLVKDPFNLSQPASEPYKRHWAKDLTLIKGHMTDAMHRPGAMTKFRQDGNSGGIWQPVELIACNDVQIKTSKIYCKIVEEDGSAIVSIDLDINNSSDKLVETDVELIVRPKNFRGDVVVAYNREMTLQPGLNQVKLVKTIQKPQLWWTWDYGKPNLYQAEICVGKAQILDTLNETFGVKKIEKDSKGQWFLNGKRIFLRGMRYISSLWISEATAESYKTDLDKMLDMTINSIRIGSHVEKDIFYDMCDEMGFLVWQVFPLHYCYSDEDELIERAAPMMRDMVAMLYNHASMGMWSVFKEPKIYGLPNKPNNYGRLCQIMYESACTVDPIRWVHTGDYEEGVQNIMIGCCAPGYTDLKRKEIKPQIVEFGAMGIPDLATLKTFIPEDKLWPPDWDTWEYWGLFYNLMFDFGRVEMGNSLQEFIDNSQVYEAKVIKEQIEFLRQRKYTPVASMYLYYWSDACPFIGSGLFDYYRRPYKAYESMKAVYTPVLVSLEWNKDPYIIGWEKIWWPGDTFVGKVWITNDHAAVDGASLAWRIVRSSDHEVILSGEKKLSIPADSAQVHDEFAWKIPPGSRASYEVQMQVRDGAGKILSKNYFDFTVY